MGSKMNHYQVPTFSFMISFLIPLSKEIFTLAISKCYGNVRIFFPGDNSLISDRKSHNSDFFGLVVRCLLFNPEGLGSNPCLCTIFFTSCAASNTCNCFETLAFQPRGSGFEPVPMH